MEAGGLAQEAIIALFIVVVVVHEGPDEAGGRAGGVQDAVGLLRPGAPCPLLLLVILIEVVLLVYMAAATSDLPARGWLPYGQSHCCDPDDCGKSGLLQLKNANSQSSWQPGPTKSRCWPDLLQG